jgi:hypothetical protein
VQAFENVEFSDHFSKVKKSDNFSLPLHNFVLKSSITALVNNMEKLMSSKSIMNNKGQGIMEYIILASLVGIFCLVAMKQFGGVLKSRINYMKKEITRNITIK